MGNLSAEFLKGNYQLLFYPFLACLLSLFLTRFLIGFMPKLGFVDLPDARRIHKTPIPRGGGIAVIVAFFVILLLCTERLADEKYLELIIRFAIPASVLTITGLIDDRFNLPSKIKLFMQIVTGVLVWLFVFQIKNICGFCLPNYISLAFTVFWVIILINAFNLIDGMDGLASGLAAISSLCLAAWAFFTGQPNEILIIPLVMAGSCLGFLRYNFNPAKIFLGDTGSMFLGLFFAMYSLINVEKSVTLSALLIPALAAGVPLFDVFLAMWRRGVRKLSTGQGGIMVADKEHLHHRILNNLTSQRKAAIKIYILAIVVAFLGLMILFFERTIPVLGFFAILLFSFMLIRKIATIELLDSARLVVGNNKRHSFKLFWVQLSIPVVDFALLTTAALCSMWVSKINIIALSWELLILTAPVIMVLFLSGSYRIVFFRSGITEILRIFEYLLLAMILDCYLFYVFVYYHNETDKLLQFLIIYTLASVLTILAFRMGMAYIGLRMLWVFKQKALTGNDVKYVLIVGGGVKAEMYLCYSTRNWQDTQIKVVGIIDDNPGLHDMIVHGHPVLGSISDLDRIYRKHKINYIVLTSEISDEKLQKIREFVKDKDIQIIDFVVKKEFL